MITSQEHFDDSLGKEPIEIFGFANEEELDKALQPLMQEILESGCFSN